MGKTNGCRPNELSVAQVPEKKRNKIFSRLPLSLFSADDIKMTLQSFSLDDCHLAQPSISPNLPGNRMEKITSG
jgi:hypothetical protein